MVTREIKRLKSKRIWVAEAKEYQFTEHIFSSKFAREYG
jgi:hypothetical protein